MTNSWDEMKKAKEDSYFERRNQEALERLRQKNSDKPLMSPVTGKPMEKVALHGVVIDRCTESGGIWLDAGELEQIIASLKGGSGKEGETHNWVTDFLKGLLP